MAQNEPTRRTSPAPDIPDRLYFRIGDVAKLCAVPPYVLRFWETEFPQLKPNKGGTGQRLYRRKDVEMALRIKRLLYDEGYTIPGARQALQGPRPEPRRDTRLDRNASTEPQLALTLETAPAPTLQNLHRLQLLRADLEDLQTILSQPVSAFKQPATQTTRSPRLVHSLKLAPRLQPSPMDDLFDPRPSGVDPG